MLTLDTLLDPTLTAAIQTVLGTPAATLAQMPARSTETVAAVIGFSGPTLAGALGVSSTSAGLALSHPLRGQIPLGDAELMDWAGELANQLFGAVKRELSSHGVIAWPSTPVSLRGVELRVRHSARCVARTYLAAEVDTMVWLECHPPEVLQLPLKQRPPVPDAQAGAVLMF